MLFHEKRPSFEGGEADTNLCYLRCRKVPPYTVGDIDFKFADNDRYYRVSDFILCVKLAYWSYHKQVAMSIYPVNKLYIILCPCQSCSRTLCMTPIRLAGLVTTVCQQDPLYRNRTSRYDSEEGEIVLVDCRMALMHNCGS